MAEGELAELREELRKVSGELARLNRHRFITIHNSWPRLLMYRFATGLAVGLGTVLGGSILLSAIVFALSSIDFIPVIGEWAAQIAAEMGGAQ